MDFTVDIGKNNITGNIAKKIKLLDRVPSQAYTFFKAITPIGKPSTWKSKPPAGYTPGNARRSTSLSKDIIHAQYPYADRLDQGYSRQAPNGMSKPTKAFIKKTVDTIIRKK